MPQSSPRPEWAGGLPQTAERRDWVRFTPHQMEVTWQLLRGDQDWLPGELQDISCHGIGLVLSKPVAVGAILRVRLSPYDLREKAVLFRVKHVASLSDEEHQVGGTFAVPLTTEQLQRLIARRQI
jgi:hypothetical protein